MSIKGQIKEMAGYVEEETGEKLHNAKMASKGRSLRNQGRVADHKKPKLTVPGTQKKHKA